MGRAATRGVLLQMPSAAKLVAGFVLALSLFAPQTSAQTAPSTYLGFDRNDYPGDATLKVLRQTFAYTGYWLSPPPGERKNSWAGHRATVDAAGFGFLMLFNGRLDAELGKVVTAEKLGKLDALAAVTSARREGFAQGVVIFLDQEQGGRMLPEQKAYIYAWVDGVIAAGYRAGIYCSGIASPDDQNVVTAEDIRVGAGSRRIVYWAINDACPPAPGCAFPKQPPSPAQSGVRFAEVWQFAQSPQRKDVAGRCPNYSREGECYAPGMAAQKMHADVNAALSADPSGGRR